MADKNSFVMYMSWLPAIKSMSDEQAGKLIKAIYELPNNPDYEIEDPAIQFVFEIIRETIKKDCAKYEETKEKRKEAIKTRWDKSKEEIQKNTNDTNEYKCIQENTNVTNDTVSVSVSDSVSVSVSDSVSVNDLKDKEKDSPTESRKRKSFSPPSLEEVRAYCEERNNGIDPETFVDFYTAKGWKVGKEPMKDWKACVRTWEKRDRGHGDNRASNKVTPFNPTNFLLQQIKEAESGPTGNHENSFGDNSSVPESL